MEKSPSNSLHSNSVYVLLFTWIVLLPLLFFVVKGMLSFDHSGYNSALAHNAGSLLRNDEDSQRYGEEQLAVSVFVLLLIVTRLRSVLVTLLARNKILLLLPIWAICSVVWSQSPLKTIFNAYLITVLTGFGALLIRRLTPDQRLHLIMLLGAVAMVFSFFTVAFFPDSGIDSNSSQNAAWEGIFITKNNCGIAMVYFCMAAFVVKAKTVLGKALLGLYIGSALVFIVMAQSRTGWLLLGAVVVFSLFLAAAKRVASKERVLLYISLAIPVAFLAFVAVTYAPQIAMLLGKDATMTGRAGIWKAIATVLWKRPFTGFGYMAFWQGLKGESGNLLLTSGFVSLANAENAILQIWLDLGLIGITLLGITLFVCCRNAIRCLAHAPTPFIKWCAMITFATLLALVDGDKIMAPNTLEWLAFVMAFIGLSDHARKIEKDNEERYVARSFNLATKWLAA